MDAEQEKKFRFRMRLEAEQAAKSKAEKVDYSPHAADASSLGQVGTGIAESAIRMGSGLNTLTGNNVPFLPTQKDVDAISSYNEGSPLATAGRVGTDILTTAIPATKLTKAAQLWGKSAPMLADVALSAGQGALTANEGEGLAGAGMGAIGSLGGSAVGSLAGRAVNPAGRISKEAQATMDAGVPLTPGQLNPSGGRAGFESILAKVPHVGAAVRARQQEAVDAGIHSLAAQLDVPTVPAENAWDVLGKLKSKVDATYVEAFQEVPPGALNNFAHNVNSTAQQLSSMRGVQSGDSRDILRDITLGTAQIKNAASPEEAARIWKDVDRLIGDKGERYKATQDEWRKSFHTIAGPDASAKMLKADLVARQVNAIEKAVGAEKQVTPQKLAKALRKKGIDPQQVMQNAAQHGVVPQDVTRLGIDAAKLNNVADIVEQHAAPHRSPWVLPQIAAAIGMGGAYGALGGSVSAAGVAIPTLLGAGAARLAYSKPGMKYMTGQMGQRQRALARFLREGHGKTAARRLGATYLAEEENK